MSATVPHDKLLHKLEQYGIKGNIHSWLTNFLSTRTMRTIVEGESSKETLGFTRISGPETMV
jgi:hypothetical protein